MNKENLSISSNTNLASLESSLDDTDYSDLPLLTDEFFERASLRIPIEQTQNLVQLDPDVNQWFQAQGHHYKKLINSVLRQYIENSETQHLE
jgi:uncharacterized protein (DUF4415 family)